MSTTHLAGPVINIGDRIIQRCSICGDKLCDNLNVEIPENRDGTPGRFCTWEYGRLVRITEGNPIAHVLLPDTEKLPEDSCIDLVE